MDLILKYFPELNPLQISRFKDLEFLYREWNDKINLISRKDIDNLYEHHILHSLSIAKVISFKPGTKILDVGTGGGFPGIPLAILFPGVEFTLNDSIAKKITVVTEISKSLGLTNVIPSNKRAEELNEKFEFIVSRAVTAFPQFVSWVEKKILQTNSHNLKNGILYLKGGDLKDELKDFSKKISIYDIKEYFNEEFFETKKVIYYPLTN